MHRVLVLSLALLLALYPGRVGVAASLLDGTVVSVVNSGTIQVQIASGPVVTVRLLGVDAPDPRAAAQGAPCFENEAAARTAELLPVGSAVGLERDIQDSDQYGRIPAYVWSGDGPSMVNEQLITEGFLKARPETMNVRHAARFIAAQQGAQVNGLGVWSACAAGSQIDPDTSEAAGSDSAP